MSERDSLLSVQPEVPFPRRQTDLVTIETNERIFAFFSREHTRRVFSASYDKPRIYRKRSPFHRYFVVSVGKVGKVNSNHRANVDKKDRVSRYSRGYPSKFIFTQRR